LQQENHWCSCQSYKHWRGESQSVFSPIQSYHMPALHESSMSQQSIHRYCVLLAWSCRYEKNRNNWLHISLFSRVCAFIIIYINFFVLRCCFFLFSQRRVLICTAEGRERFDAQQCALCRGCQMTRTVQDVEEGRRVTDERRAVLKICRNNTVASRESRCERSKANME
jgi:hypothetical protein